MGVNPGSTQFKTASCKNSIHGNCINKVSIELFEFVIQNYKHFVQRRTDRKTDLEFGGDLFFNLFLQS